MPKDDEGEFGRMSNRRDESAERTSGEALGKPEGAPDEPRAGAPSEAPSAEARIAELEELLRQKSEEAAANFDRYLRAVADAENLRKRVQREKMEAIRFANETVLRDLLPIVDNLETALEHAGLGGNGKSVVEGVQLILRLFRDLLERHGVKELGDPTGGSFDPETQEAADVQASEKVKPNTVIRQQMKGYRYHDRLLRPARVVVAGSRETAEPGEGEGTQESGGTKKSTH